MNSYKSALSKLKRNKISIKNEIVSIKDSLNRVSTSDIFSPVNYPACLVETESVAHADDKGNAMGQSDANTDYFARLSLDGSKWVYNTSFGAVSQTSSSATAAVASMWVTANTPKGIVNPIS